MQSWWGVFWGPVQDLVTEFQQTVHEGVALCKSFDLWVSIFWFLSTMELVIRNAHMMLIVDMESWDSDQPHHLLRTWDSWLAAEAKEQVVAHLANFAYDPFNFEHLRTVLSSIPGFHKILEDCLTGGTDRFSWRGSPFYLRCDFPALTAACSGSIPGLLDRAQREASWICIRWDM
jgi:hypothetical protein